MENTVQTVSHYWPWPCCNSEQFDIEYPRVRLLQSCWCWCVSEGQRWGLAIDLWLLVFTSSVDMMYLLWRQEERVLTVMYFFKNQLWRHLMSCEGSVIESSLRRKLGLGKCIWHLAIREHLLKLLTQCADVVCVIGYIFLMKFFFCTVSREAELYSISCRVTSCVQLGCFPRIEQVPFLSLVPLRVFSSGSLREFFLATTLAC